MIENPLFWTILYYIGMYPVVAFCKYHYGHDAFSVYERRWSYGENAHTLDRVFAFWRILDLLIYPVCIAALLLFYFGGAFHHMLFKAVPYKKDLELAAEARKKLLSGPPVDSLEESFR